MRHSLLVGQGANDGAKNHGRPKPRNEEPANVAAAKAVVLIEVVHVRPLEPVPCHGELQRRENLAGGLWAVVAA